MSPLLVRAVWKSPIPSVMTTSGAHRIKGASRRKTGGCFLLCFCFPFFSCMRTLTSELDFLKHFRLNFLLFEKKHLFVNAIDSPPAKWRCGSLSDGRGLCKRVRTEAHFAEENHRVGTLDLTRPMHGHPKLIGAITVTHCCDHCQCFPLTLSSLGRSHCTKILRPLPTLPVSRLHVVRM